MDAIPVLVFLAIVVLGVTGAFYNIVRNQMDQNARLQRDLTAANAAIADLRTKLATALADAATSDITQPTIDAAAALEAALGIDADGNPPAQATSPTA